MFMMFLRSYKRREIERTTFTGMRKARARKGQLRMVFAFLGGTGLTFLQPTPLNRIVRSRRADVVRDHRVMGDHVALVSMIPAPADVVDQLALMIHQGISDGN